jgi:hypothetical protein
MLRNSSRTINDLVLLPAIHSPHFEPHGSIPFLCSVRNRFDDGWTSRRAIQMESPATSRDGTPGAAG